MKSKEPKKSEEEKELDKIWEAQKLIEKQIKTMKPCPFCGCKMTAVIDNGTGCVLWAGNHAECTCPIEGNPSHSYGRLTSMVKEWNRRS